MLQLLTGTLGGSLDVRCSGVCSSSSSIFACYFNNQRLPINAISQSAACSVLVMAEWCKPVGRVKGVLLDICGVLYESGDGGGVPIVGSVEAVKR